jgi:hypothetical protein
MKGAVPILNSVIAVYFFLLANFVLWASVLAIFIGAFAKQELLENPYFVIKNILLSPFLMYAAIIFFRKPPSKYTYGIVMMLIMVIETTVYRYFFITNNKLEGADLTNLLFFGIPLGVILFTKYLEKTSTR